MLKALFPERDMSDEDFMKIKKEVNNRLDAGLRGDVMPKLTFSPIGFHAPTTKEGESAWGTAHSLLLGAAKYPREAMAGGSYFARNFKVVKPEEVFAAMDILNDPFYKHAKFGSDWEWAKNVELPTCLKSRRQKSTLNTNAELCSTYKDWKLGRSPGKAQQRVRSSRSRSF